MECHVGDSDYNKPAACKPKDECERICNDAKSTIAYSHAAGQATGGQESQAAVASCSQCGSSTGDRQARSSSGGAGPEAGGFGFRSSGGVAAVCACDAGFGWQMNGDHPCGCTAKTTSSDDFFLGGPRQASGQVLLSAAMRGRCNKKCCCCIDKLCVGEGVSSDVAADAIKRLSQYRDWGFTEVYAVFHWSIYWSTRGPGGLANPACTWSMWEYSNTLTDGVPSGPSLGRNTYSRYVIGEWNYTTALHEGAAQQAVDCEDKQECPRLGHCGFSDAVQQTSADRKLKRKSGYVLQYVLAKSGCPGCKDCCGMALIDLERKTVSVRMTCGDGCGEAPPGGNKPRLSPPLLFHSTWLGNYYSTITTFKLGGLALPGHGSKEVCV